MKKRIGREITQYTGMLFGSIIFAMAYSWFLVPYRIVPGGVGGLAQIFFFVFGIPIGVTMVLINIPLFVVSFLMLGKTFGLRSFLGMFISSVLTDLLDLQRLHSFGIVKDLSQFEMMVGGMKVYTLLPNDVYLAAIAGSVLLGLGLGTIFRFRGSTGGTDIPVAIIKQKTGLSLGTGYWIIETFIIVTVGVVFQDLKLVIWGYVNLFITAKITDLASEGLPYIKGAFIVSEKYEEIRLEILERIQRGVTLFKAEGGFLREDKIVLFCVLNRRQVSELRDIVRDIDPKAFMILTDVNDVMGLGFKSRNLNLSDNS